ncbi:MAG: hypothetical protein AAFU85_24495 [Planctomycetota bacterium]
MMKSTLVDVLEVTHYEQSKTRCETISDPGWHQIESEIRTMHRMSKPLVSLLQDRDNPGSNMLTVTGGAGIYHVQTANDRAQWQWAFDPEGSTDEIEIWQSDQGFSPPRNWTWALGDTLRIVRHYFQTGASHPDFDWM